MDNRRRDPDRDRRILGRAIAEDLGGNLMDSDKRLYRKVEIGTTLIELWNDVPFSGSRSYKMMITKNGVTHRVRSFSTWLKRHAARQEEERLATEQEVDRALAAAGARNKERIS
jgi:hypothetical protein